MTGREHGQEPERMTVEEILAAESQMMGRPVELLDNAYADDGDKRVRVVLYRTALDLPGTGTQITTRAAMYIGHMPVASSVVRTEWKREKSSSPDREGEDRG